jgi:hypothetical protein
VGRVPLTDRIGALALASVPNDVSARGDDGMGDYRGPLRPAFRLRELASGTLAGVAREFQMQTHLLVAAGELTLSDRFGDARAREMIAATCVGAGWVVSERLAAALGASPDATGLSSVLALHPMLPPGVARAVTVDGDRVRMTLAAGVPGLLDAAHPGCPGLLARHDPRAVEAMVHAILPAAAVEIGPDGPRITVEIDTAAGRQPVTLPDAAALTRVGLAASWSFPANLLQ